MKQYLSVCDVKGFEVEPVDIVSFGSPCFPKGTLVLTENGYVPIEEIRIGDRVFTHKGNWKEVTAVGHCESPTVKMKGYHYGLIATPNHPFYSAECNRKWINGRPTRTLTNVGVWESAEHMQGKMWSVPNRFSGLGIPPIERDSARGNATPNPDENLMYIVGRWLGDGWLRDNQRSKRPTGQTSGQIYICANETKSKYLIERLYDVFGDTAAVFCENTRTVNKFRICNMPLCKWLKRHFGHMADGKKLPAWALCMNHTMRQALLQGYLDSDGYRFNAHTWKATTVSKKLAHGIRLLAETLGYSCTVHYAVMSETTVIEGRVVNQKPQFQVVLCKSEKAKCMMDGRFNWYRCKSVEPYRDKETVYNMTVADDHSYIVEGFVVHNCQDLSVAGKRAGMKHTVNGDEETTRSGLFMEAIRIIREMREATNGKQPRFALWENVPGAFSSHNGQDFRIVLEELAKIADETASVPLPEKGKWATAGSILGDGYSICWRTLDAQYHGVPQRRRRVFLVADFNGECAEEVLFECQGLPGYPQKSGESGQEAAAAVGGGTHPTGCYGIQGSMIGRADRNGPYEPLYCMATQQGGAEIGENFCPTITASAGLSGNNQPSSGSTIHQASGFCTEHSANSRSIGYEEELSPTLRAGITPAVVHDNGTTCAEADCPR